MIDEFISRYSVPVANPDAPRPALVWSRRGEGRIRSLAGQVRRRVHGRRLAYIDSHFPWQRSGLRYADALALHEARPDTVFFSMYELRDRFPAPVLPLAQFPRLAPSLGITDVYGVFLSFMAGVLGLYRSDPHEPGPLQGLDLSGVIRRDGIRAHVGLYPGGGFAASEENFALAGKLAAAADQVFSWSPAVLAGVPGVTAIAPAVIDTAFYAKAPRDFARRPLELLFAADAESCEGLDVALAAVVELAGEPVHLHVVGPRAREAAPAPPEIVTFHGWLEREALRELHARCHAFLSPVRADGFPTAAAAEAMSSGLLLIGANPDADHRHMRPGIDYIEASAPAFAAAIRSVLADPQAAARTADSGAARVRERLDVRHGARERLALMGFGPTLASVAEQVRALGTSLERVRAQQEALAEQLTTEHRLLVEELRSTRRDLIEVGQLALDDEAGARKMLAAAREGAGYEEPFTDPNPLVSVCIPTYTNYERLIDRSIASVLAQDHPNVEVVVVGDTAPPETAAAIEKLNDPRVRYENLAIRGPYPEDADRRWLVAGVPALNRSLQLARGAWIVINNDDDELRPHHISRLLEEAQRTRDEVVYGRLLMHRPDGSAELGGAFPPVTGAFGWQLALQHRAMRMFEYNLFAYLFGEPGDGDRARRMLRAGVRFRMIDEVVCDYYPSTLWGSR